MKTTIINKKKYTVEYVFNMVGNWVFTDKHGTQFLVDAQDVAIFGGDGDCSYTYDGQDTDGTDWYLCNTHDELAIGNETYCAKWVREPKITVDTAIEYAKQLASENEEGIFYWKVKEHYGN